MSKPIEGDIRFVDPTFDGALREPTEDDVEVFVGGRWVVLRDDNRRWDSLKCAAKPLSND